LVDSFSINVANKELITLGILSGLAKATFVVAAVAVAGPLLLPVLMSGDMSGIDGYCDDE
jgi:hypothetical protein